MKFMGRIFVHFWSCINKKSKQILTRQLFFGQLVIFLHTFKVQVKRLDPLVAENGKLNL